MNIKDLVCIKGDKETKYQIVKVEARSDNPDSNHYHLVSLNDGHKVLVHHSKLIPVPKKRASH